jgi:hypothetical protein
MDQQEQLIWFRSYLLDNNSDFFDKGNILISNNINYTQPLHQHNVKQTPRIHIAKTKEEIKRKKSPPTNQRSSRKPPPMAQSDCKTGSPRMTSLERKQCINTVAA